MLYQNPTDDDFKQMGEIHECPDCKTESVIIPSWMIGAKGLPISLNYFDKQLTQRKDRIHYTSASSKGVTHSRAKKESDKYMGTHGRHGQRPLNRDFCNVALDSGVNIIRDIARFSFLMYFLHDRHKNERNQVSL